MIKVNDFFTEDASDMWFAESYGRTDPVHDKLKSAGNLIVDRERLGKDYKDTMAPFDIVDLAFGARVPVPPSGFRTAMILGRIIDLKKTEKEGICMKDVLDEWMQLLRGDEKYIMSLNPKDYLFATSSSVSFEDIENITYSWVIDCYIGIFDSAHEIVFAYNEEWGMVYVGFAMSNVPPQFDLVRDVFEAKTRSGYVEANQVVTAGQRERVEEYYQKVVMPVTERG